MIQNRIFSHLSLRKQLKQLLLVSIALICCGYCPCDIYSDVYRTPIIPQDASEASDMLRKGTLDSTLWNSIKDYYLQPISVPDGELVVLPEIFPEVLWPYMPVSDSQLNIYEPWRSNDVERFYRDYPFLQHFAPILSFSRNNSTRRIGWTKFTLSKMKDTDPIVSNSILITPYNCCRYEARTEVEQANILFKRRCITFKHKNIGVLKLGNFQNSSLNNLYFGYFQFTEPFTSIKDNWLYASSKTWNGAYAQGMNIGFFRPEIFFHSRHTETVVGVSSRFGKKKFFDMNVAPVAIVLKERQSGKVDTQVVICTNTRVFFYEWNVGFSSGVSLRQPHKVPFLTELEHSRNYSKMLCRITFFPANFFQPLSIEARSTARRLSWNDTIIEPTGRIELKYHTKEISGIIYTTILSYIVSANAASAKALMDIQCNSLVLIKIYYCIYPYLTAGADAATKHNFSVSIDKIPLKYVDGSVVASLYSGSKTLPPTYRLNISFNIDPIAFVLVKPFLAVSAIDKKKYNCYTGLKYQLNISERTYSRFQIKIPLQKHADEAPLISAEACFAL